MIEFGKTLRQAREARGLTIAQVAEATRMMSSMVQKLEEEDFSGIPAPIYGRGFVKLYCEAVGIDAKPLIDEFMEIVNGNRNPTIRERQAPPPQSPRTNPPAADTETPAAEEPPATPAEQLGLFDRPITPSASIARPASPVGPAPASTVSDGSRTSRYAPPQAIEEIPPPALFHINWRMFAVIAVGAVILLVAFAGLRALHSATSGEPADRAAATSEAAYGTAARPAAATPNASPAKPALAQEKRKATAVDPLYVD